MTRILYVLAPVLLQSCTPDPSQQKRDLYYDKAKAAKRLSLKTGVDFSSKFLESEFEIKMRRKGIVLSKEPFNTSYVKCASKLSSVTGYHVRSMSLNEIDSGMPGAVDIAFDNNGKYICFEVFQPKK
jgi:hypothetical protein